MPSYCHSKQSENPVKWPSLWSKYFKPFVAVTYAGERSFTRYVVNTGTIDVLDVTLSGPGFASPVSPTKASFTGSGTMVTASYEFTPPGGSWDGWGRGRSSSGVR